MVLGTKGFTLRGNFYEQEKIKIIFSYLEFSFAFTIHKYFRK